MKKLILMALALLISFGVFATDAPNISPYADSGWTKVETDFNYSDVANVTVMDVWMPSGSGLNPSPNPNKPGVIFFHPGAWTSGDKSSFHNQAEYLASKGMVTFSINYQLALVSKITDPPSLFDGTQTPYRAWTDAEKAIRYIRAHAAKYGINPSHLAVSGGSAGGHLAAALATSTPTTTWVNGVSSSADIRPNALILFNPVLNLNTYTPWDTAWTAKDSINPLIQLNETLPNTIIFQGDNDNVASYTVANNFMKCATQTVINLTGDALVCQNNMASITKAPNVTLVDYVDRPHGFYNDGQTGGGAVIINGVGTPSTIIESNKTVLVGAGNDYIDVLKKTWLFIEALNW
ncbi:MAG: alpha/beta hydrolase [Methylobacter sp.]|nr:MAG: alpha/beta hydrolase [Methylobacter sp.]